MFDNPIQAAFVMAMLSMACVGAYCAHHLTGDHPWWVRLIVMAPAVIGMFAPVAILMGVYAPRLLDATFATSVALLYALLATRFSSTPWPDICRRPD